MIDEYENYPSLEDMKNALIKTNIGYDPQKDKKYNWNKQNEKTIKKYWLACKLQKQRGDISEINCFPYADLLTFSFPCQSISVAGKQEGIIQGETKSGLVYEVLRILENMKTKNILPKYLLLENVKNLVGKKFINDFNNLNSILDDIGYNVYWKVINAKNCNIPQNRERVFGIYIRKDIDNQTFEFPNNLPLEYKLKDLLEKEVDEKYYIDMNKAELSLNKALENTYKNKNARYEMAENDIFYPLHSQDFVRTGFKDICPTLTARDYKDPKCVQVGSLSGGKWDKLHENSKRVCDESGSAPTIHTCGGGNIEPKVMTYSSYVNGKYEKFIKEKGYIPKIFNPYNMKEILEISPTLTAQGDSITKSGTVLLKEEQKTTKNSFDNFKIRKLTPTECYMLQGFTKEDIDKCYAVNMSNTQLYRQSGNSIVTNCIELLFERLFKHQYNNDYITLDERISANDN